VLAEGGTIEQKNVISKTLKAYLKAAADFMWKQAIQIPGFPIRT